MSKLKSYFFPILLVLFSVVLSALNYIPGTYLSGWDTIHPEFNFAEYFNRTLNVWQQHQGLGAVASQAHGSELPRLVIYYLSSLILPDSFLRYFYFFLCLIFGPLGTYALVRKFITDKSTHLIRESTAFLGGLLYLLNLTTLQHFIVPLEMFATHYATLPWVILFATKYLLESRKKDLALFGLSIFFSIPMAHTPTLFYVFFGVFSLYTLFFSYLKKISLRKSIALILITLGLNSYWLLPNIYFVKQYGAEVANSKIHSQFSDRAFQVGTIFGNLADTALLKNFLFNWGEYDEKNGYFVYLLKTWQSHINNLFITIIGFSVFLAVLIGLVISIRKKESFGLATLVIFLIPFFFINNDNFLFNRLVLFFENYFPVLRESLRFPFTKFSILLLLTYCIYFAVAINYFLNSLNEKKQRLIAVSSTVIISLLLVIFMWPAFSGNLLAKSMKVNIPNEYFQMFDWFETQDPNSRVAMFPIHTFWGWSYYKWGYEGAGFLWFGLKQPLLNREFDRWRMTNENYYWEASYALYSRNLSLLEEVLDKYQIRWLLFDENIVDASSAKSPYLNEFNELIRKSNRISLKKSFGDIKVYEVADESKSKNFVSVKTDLPTIGPDYQRSSLDFAYLEKGEYLTKADSDTYYPFRSIFTNINPNEHEFLVEETDEYIIFKNPIPKNLKDYQLKTIDQTSAQITWHDSKKLDSEGIFNPAISINNSYIEVKIPKVKGYFSASIDPTKVITTDKLLICDYLSLDLSGRIRHISNERLSENQKNFLRLNSIISNNCSPSFLLPSLSHDYAYIITADVRNVENKSLLFWLENLNSRRADMETYLPREKNFNKYYFIQPPMEKYGTGYNLHFDNWSFNKTKTVNDLSQIEVYPIPYEFLLNLSFEKKNSSKVESQDCQYEVSKKSQSLYFVDLQTDDKCKDEERIVALYQSFDPGWAAINLSGFKFYEHTLLNNWANGFVVKNSNNARVMIIFLPQLLQALGLLIFFATVSYISIGKRVKKSE